MTLTLSLVSLLGPFLGIVLSCALPMMLAIVGLLVGTLVEQMHLQRLDASERELLTIPLTDLKTLPPGLDGRTVRGATMVAGSVVISTDYFRTFTSTLRKLIGGEMRFYNRLMMRGRREAVCRMMEQARRLNAVAVVNLRLESSNIGGMSKNPAPMVEVIAYGTAVFGDGAPRPHSG
ncbi:MAG TPA: heavy metal-binding domain-containing protein [Phycisphaerales bacterium]|nr:heavy metal-binding domain-containing protein [Phycisphaerales bacterium]HRQ75531.1 heavy metal-binding domain-containing protein [Phycisphaerales bacterium]